MISYNPGESVDWELLNGPILGRGGCRLAPVEGGTQFTLVAGVKPSGAYKLLGPLFAWMGRRRNQADVEKKATRVLQRHGPERAETFLTDYSRQCTTQVGYAYHELVDYLMLQYLVGYGQIAPPNLPQVGAPVVPDVP